jgi:AcrR family transcriptional regulator
MPKIIDNARGILIEEAKKQINENGYDNVTIRSIARGCKIGLGTFYNYFKTKDFVVVAYLLDEWKERINRVNEISETESDPMVVVRALHKELSEFVAENQGVFKSERAMKSFSALVGSKYHRLFRGQIAEPIEKICLANDYENAEFLALYVAESIIVWTTVGKTYEELEPIISKLFVK